MFLPIGTSKCSRSEGRQRNLLIWSKTLDTQKHLEYIKIRSLYSHIPVFDFLNLLISHDDGSRHLRVMGRTVIRVATGSSKCIAETFTFSNTAGIELIRITCDCMHH